MKLVLHARYEVVVVRVRADPKPDNVFSGANPERPVIEADPYRVDRHGRMDLFEAQARMMLVLLKDPVGLSGLTLDPLR